MADINERLREAAKSGDETELKALLREPGCDACSKNRWGVTALMWAACCGSEACLNLLLPLSDVLAKDEGGRTALMGAASNGREACVRLLLPTGDALARDAAGKTALMHAAVYGYKDCVRLLLPVSDTSAEDAHGITASVWAKKRGGIFLAQFIDAYVLSQSEKVEIGVASFSKGQRGRAVRRM